MKEQILIDIYDSEGKLIKTLSSLEKKVPFWEKDLENQNGKFESIRIYDKDVCITLYGKEIKIDYEQEDDDIIKKRISYLATSIEISTEKMKSTQIIENNHYKEKNRLIFIEN